MEHPIMLNGASAATNVKAFRRGRQVVCDPAAIEELIKPKTVGEKPLDLAALEVLTTVRAEPGTEFQRLLAVRVPDLADYQDVAYARDFAEFVEHIRRVEAGMVPGSTVLAETVARYLYKLMAYKDEYEVARLMLQASMDDAVADEFGADATYRVQLHPPLLRAMGLKNKIGLGPRTMPVFKALRRARRLRGTRLDIFGYHPVRRLERELVEEYRANIESVLARLSPDTLAVATKMAGLPDQVCGYEQIKVDNVVGYRNDLAATQAELTRSLTAATSSGE